MSLEEAGSDKVEDELVRGFERLDVQVPLLYPRICNALCLLD